MGSRTFGRAAITLIVTLGIGTTALAVRHHVVGTAVDAVAFNPAGDTIYVGGGPSNDVKIFKATSGVFALTRVKAGTYAEGEQLGGPTLTARDGGAVRNLLRVFEGCFDTM